MARKFKHAMGAILGAVFALGISVERGEVSTASIASLRFPGEIVLGLNFSKVLADSKRRQRTRDRRAEEQKAEEKRREEAEKKFIGARRANLPVDCVYDDNASTTNSVDTYLCGGIYYQRYEENGVTGYEGYAVGMDRGEIDQAKARRTEAAKKRRAAAEKKKQAARISELPADCAYDSWASTSSPTDVYQCGAVRYRQYQEKGITGYEVFKP